MTGTVAVLSGGLDSTAALFLYVRENTSANPLVLTFNYGQPAAQRELDSASFFASSMGLEHLSINLDWMASLVPPALNSVSSNDKAVWVPNRNGVFVAVAAAIAEARGGGDLIFGFNRDEGASFPDNTLAFIDASNNALLLSTGGKVSVVSPTVNMTKHEIAVLLDEMGVDTSRLWSCYGSGPVHCGKCPSCIRLFDALASASIPADKHPRRR